MEGEGKRPAEGRARDEALANNAAEADAADEPPRASDAPRAEAAVSMPQSSAAATQDAQPSPLSQGGAKGNDQTRNGAGETSSGPAAVAKSRSIEAAFYEPWRCRSVECFKKIEQIGEGTYGQVYMAKDKATGEVVALKKVRMDNEKEGFPITAIREIKILRTLEHRNIVNLKEIVVSEKTAKNQNRESIYMVMEYLDHDLTGLAERPDIKFEEQHIKCYMRQLLQGLHYCHLNKVLHRDIKVRGNAMHSRKVSPRCTMPTMPKHVLRCFQGSNLLINNNGILKLADFGLARSYTADMGGKLTNRVITLWYRPPELLLGADRYGPGVDMWSVGCIFAELLMTRPILPGKSEIEQLELTFKLCGSPDATNWPDASKLPWHSMFVSPDKQHKRRIREVFQRFKPEAIDLIDKLLTLNPKERISAKAALTHSYFFTHPLPCEPKDLPKIAEASHEFQTKKRRQQLKQQQAEQEASKRARLEQQQYASRHGDNRGHYHGQHHGGYQGPAGRQEPRYGYSSGSQHVNPHAGGRNFQSSQYRDQGGHSNQYANAYRQPVSHTTSQGQGSRGVAHDRMGGSGYGSYGGGSYSRESARPVAPDYTGRQSQYTHRSQAGGYFQHGQRGEGRLSAAEAARLSQKEAERVAGQAPRKH